MILHQYEETAMKNAALPPGWRSEARLEELEEFLQQNWDQRSVFYEDRHFETKQQFLGFTSHRGLRTKKYIGTIVFAGEQNELDFENSFWGSLLFN